MPPPGAPRCLILTTYTPNASIDTMASDIAFALGRFGVRVGFYVGGNYGDPKLFEAMMLMIGQSKAPAFVFDMNARLNPQVLNPKVGAQSLFDAWRLPRVSFVIDNLFHHADRVAAAPDHALTGLIDADSLDWVDQIAPGGRSIFHLPHAGPEPSRRLPTTAERPIDLLFAGNIRALPPLPDWLAARALPEPFAPVVAQAIERSLAGPEAVYQAVEASAEALSVETGLNDRLLLSRTVEDYIRNRRRIDLFAAFKKTRVTVYGEIERDALPAGSDAIETADTIPFLDLLDVMRRAKCVLNVSPSLRGGGHERLFYGIANGCFGLTDFSRYLEGEAREGLGVGFTPFNAAEIDDMVASILGKSDAAFDAVREKALDHYRRAHTWTERMERVLYALHTHFPGLGFQPPERSL